MDGRSGGGKKRETVELRLLEMDRVCGLVVMSFLRNLAENGERSRLDGAPHILLKYIVKYCSHIL